MRSRRRRARGRKGRGRQSLLSLAGLLAASLAGCGGPSKPRNLLLVTIDTLRADRIGCYGAADARTPVLDALAAEGAVFETAVTSVPLTLPSHVSLFTGRQPPGHGVRVNGEKVAKEIPLLATLLSGRGYATAGFIGAAVLGTSTGIHRGFETFDREFVVADPNARAERRAAEVNASVAAWSERGTGGRPFFLWVHYFDPHDPYQPPPPFDAEFQGRGYDGEVAYADHCLGELLEGLRRRRLLEDTLLVVASDHGEGLGERGERTHGLLLYDATVRVPLLFHAPGRVPAARVKGQARLVDVLPTVLSFLGLPLPERLDGESLLPAIRAGAIAEERPAYLETYTPFNVYRWAWLRGVRTERAKYVEAVRPELYDLAADPRETRNLFDPARPPLGLVSALERLASLSAGGGPDPRPGPPAGEEELSALGYAGGGSAPLPPERPPRDPKDLLWIDLEILRAREASARGEGTAALEVYGRLEEADPTNPEIQFRRALLLLENGRAGEAERALRRVVELHETWSRPRALLADLAEKDGRTEEAGRWLEEAVRLDPESNSLRILSAVRQALAGREAEAEALLRKAAAERPGLVEDFARRKRAELAAERTRPPNAEILLRLLDRVAPP